MKILVITETLDNGGAELFTLRLVRHLRKAKIDVTLLSMNKVYENHEMTLQFDDVPIIRFDLPFVKCIERLDYILLRLGIDFSIKFFFQKMQLQRLISKHRYHIIHTHTIQIDHLVSRIRKNNKNFRHVVTIHGDYSAQYAKMNKGIGLVWLNLMQKLNLLKQYVDYWVVLSDEQESFLKRVMEIKSNYKKVYNGFVDSYKRLDDSNIKNFIGNDFVFGMIARGEREKGWEVLITAFNKLPKKCKLILAGGGEYLDMLKQKYSDNKRILFTGFYPDPIGLLKNTSVLILPSAYLGESLPTVVIEALYTGVPVIASDIHEMKNMILDETTFESAGFRIPFIGCNLDEHELHSKMLYLYENPHLLQKLSKIAKQAYAKFNMEKCIENYLEVYNQLTGVRSN